MWSKILKALKWWLKDLVAWSDKEEPPDPKPPANGIPDYYMPTFYSVQEPSPHGGPALVIASPDYVGLGSGGSISLQAVEFLNEDTGRTTRIHWRNIHRESKGSHYDWCENGAHGDHCYTTRSQENVPSGRLCSGKRQGLAWVPFPRDLGPARSGYTISISWRATTNRGKAYVGFIVRKPGNRMVCEWLEWNQRGNGTSGEHNQGFHTIKVMEHARFVQD